MSDLTEQRKPSLEKWPFWVADGVLVMVALVIAFFSGDGMSAFNAFAVVSCMIAGVVSLVAPYYLEFSTYARHQMQEHEQGAQDRLRRLDDAISALRAARDQFESAQNTEQEKILMTLGGKFEALKTQIDSLGKKVSKVTKAEGEQAAPEIGKQLTKLEASVSEMQQTLHGVQMVVERVLEDLPSAELESGADELPESDGRLMAKAFGGEKGPETGGTAIDRIIRSEKREDDGEAKAEVEETETEAEIEAVAEEEIIEETEDVTAEEDVEAEEKDGEKDSEEEAESELALKEEELEGGEENGDGNPLRTKTRKRKSKKGKSGKETRIIVEALIGIGNKPYLRGDGAGLSPDKGVPMDYVEIGKWEWVSSELSEPMNCHVYLNDETPAKDETELKPGDNLTVSPIFS